MSNVSQKCQTELFVVEGDLPKLSKQIDEQLPTEIFEYNNAFILYTSGTTGKPKGKYEYLLLLLKKIIINFESIYLRRYHLSICTT